MDVPLALVAVGAVLSIAFAAGLLFRQYRIPDIPFLLALGGVLAWTGLVPRSAGSALPFLAALILVMVIFDAALELRPDTRGKAGVTMAFATFALTTVGCGAVAMLAGMDVRAAALLGMCFGGAGIVIIIPLARRMGIGPEGMGIVVMEAVTSDVLVILGVSVAAAALVGTAGAGTAIIVAKALLVGGIVGVASGWLWGQGMTRWQMQNAYGITLAALLLVYAVTEVLGGSGPLAVLAFGLLGGRALHRRPDAHLIDFHHEAMFFVRAFFFVGLGLVTQWSLLADVQFLLLGAALTGAIWAARAMASLTLPSGLGRDRSAIALLFPMGLVAAAASLLPQAAGVPGTDRFDELAAVVIVLSNVAAAVAVAVRR